MSTVTVTWWGHATVTIELAGVRLLTDPVLSARVAHLRRIGSPVPPGSARDTDGVLISHLHPDHLHLASLRRIAAPAELVAPLGIGSLLMGGWRGAAVHELTAGSSIPIGTVEVRAVPAHHDGRRLPGSPHRGPALGYVVSDGTTRVWFAGDTGLFDGLADLAPVDLAVLPVGGWGPTLGPHHLDPEQAATAAALVGARHAVPIHYGTFWPTGLRRMAPGTFARKFAEPGHRFAVAASRLAPDTRVRVLACGETATFDG